MTRVLSFQAGALYAQALTSLLQSLLRELVPDSFPARLGPDSAAPGMTQRRFIIIDEAVHALYGEQMDKVTAATQLPVQAFKS